MKVSLISIFIFLTLALNAQFKEIHYGIKGGLNLGHTIYDRELFFSNEIEGGRWGKSLGLVMEGVLNNNIAVISGLDFVFVDDAGQDDIITDIDNNTGEIRDLYAKYWVSSKYLQVPVLVIFKTGTPDSRIRFFGLPGFGFGFCLGSSQHFRTFDLEGNEVYSTDTKGNLYKTVRLSGILATGLEFKLSQTLRMLTGVKIDYGLNSINKSESIKVWNHFAEFNVSVLF